MSAELSRKRDARADLRMLTPEDIIAVETIERRAYPAPWSREALLGELCRPQGLNIAACIGEELCGYMLSFVVADETHILNLAVDPAWQGRGIGRQLLEAALERGAARGAHVATLEVRRSNTRAIRLYESLGFRFSALRARYYRDNGEDALVLELDLDRM